MNIERKGENINVKEKNERVFSPLFFGGVGMCACVSKRERVCMCLRQ